MANKSKGTTLQSADQYLWIGPPMWFTFERGNIRIKLGTITNERIDQLMKDDPSYWGEKFTKIPSKPPKEVAE